MKELEIKKDLGFKQINEVTSDEIFMKDEAAFKESLFSLSKENIANSIKINAIQSLIKTHLDSKKELSRSFYSFLAVILLSCMIVFLIPLVSSINGAFVFATMSFVVGLLILASMIMSFTYMVKSIMNYFSASSMLKKLSSKSSNTGWHIGGLVVFFLLGALAYPLFYFSSKKQQEDLNEFLIKNGLPPLENNK